MNKVYAKQVPPEWQTSPLDYWGMPENVTTDGNIRFNSHMTPEYEHINRHFDNMAYYWEHGCYTTIAEALQDYGFCRNDGKTWSNKDKHKWRLLMEGNATSDDGGLICEALELITGIEFDYATIRGCCQSDWQDVYFPAKYGLEWLKEFEAEYFNTGTEWIVDTDGYAFSIYITEWRDDDIRARIADAAGISVDNVILIDYNGEEIAV